MNSLEGILVALPPSHADNDALFETLVVLRDVQEVGLGSCSSRQEEYQKSY